ncbi:LAMI_0D00980g1_1 [Lachancea mirantina]|uniref:Superoxide dismutase 1 copper chaperone n=1 Tax=Lachancea mirantina TaxID=1230905 RepID=A0A1G4J8Z1_9SACH|nr:LAMI_0D00980g1_1 [Lachancea mirantina]
MTATNFDDVFEANYAVDMHCESCTKDIKTCLSSIPGLELNFYVPEKILNVKGTAAPSTIISTLQKCGRDAIIRGTGQPNSAAVSILETFGPVSSNDTPVRGLARIVSANEHKTWFDITLNGVPHAGKYYASIRASGDISKGAQSTGEAIQKFDEPIDCDTPSDLGKGLYSGQAFLSASIPVWQLIGRGFLVTTNADHKPGSNYDICGVIARSAGIWENDKQVCACSGKSVWEERKDALNRNIK